MKLVKSSVFGKILDRIIKFRLERNFERNCTSCIDKLESEYSNLKDIEACIAQSKNSLTDEHSYYVSNVSIGNSAVSIEAASFLDCFLRRTSARRIIDLGSGFSSYVLRKYKADSKFDVEVWSVDSSKNWLEKTGDYLASRGLNTENLCTWSEFEEHFEGKYDLIFLDVRPISRRVDWVDKLSAALSVEGALVVDDVHKEHMRIPMLIKYSKKLEHVINLKTLSIDKLGRYSALITPMKINN